MGKSGIAVLRVSLLGLSLVLAACFAAKQDSWTQLDRDVHPPVAGQVPYKVVSPNGTRPDPYYWLRDDTRKQPNILEYLKAENEYADRMMAHTKPLQEKLFGEIVGHIQEDDTSVPVRDKGWWYFLRTAKGDEHPVLMRRRDAGGAPEQVMLDENAMAAGHAYFSVGGWQVSPNSKLLAWSEDTTGRFTYTVRLKNLDTGKPLPDVLTGADPEVIWGNDKTILYLEKDPVTLLASRVRKHVLGTAQSADALVYEEPDKSFYIGLSRSKSERYLFIELNSTDVWEWRYADVSDPKLEFKVVYPREPRHEYQVENLGWDFIIRTNWEAPNFRIMTVPVKNAGDRGKWKPLVPHRGHVFIENFEVYKNCLAINERSGGLLRVTVKDWDTGREHFINGDEPSYAVHLVQTPEIDSGQVRLEYDSLATPDTIYEYDVRTGEQRLLKVEPTPGYDPKDYVTEFVFAPARDGVRIPVSLVYRKGFKKDGTAPMLVEGYGSYGVSEDPQYAPTSVPLRSRGVVLAIVHVRGGGEMGRAWYDDGRLLHKKNTFNDFVDATDYLVRQKYAAPDKVFAEGGSAGGLLMGAIANQRPDLYRGIIADVPFVDVVTTMLDPSIPLTSNEYDEWGDPTKKTYYDYMLSYSPYDNVSAQKYPAMLVTAGLWDSRVGYWEPAKWVAKLRARKQGRSPLIFHINMEAGHHGKSGRYERFHEQAFEYAFVLDQLGIQE